MITDELVSIFSGVGIVVGPEEHGEQLDIDSLSFITLIIAIEDYYQILIPEEDLVFSKLRSFSDYQRVVEHVINT